MRIKRCHSARVTTLRVCQRCQRRAWEVSGSARETSGRVRVSAWFGICTPCSRPAADLTVLTSDRDQQPEL